MKWDGITFLQYLENPWLDLVTLPGSPKEGQPCSYLEVLRACVLIDWLLRVVGLFCPDPVP